MSVDVEVRLKLRDAATAPMKASAQEARQEAAKTATATEKAAAAAAAAAERGAAQQRTSFQRMAQARETLGIRSEHAVQREIARTEAAYQRLRESGTLSFRQQMQAADAMRRKVTELNNEMGRLTASQKMVAGAKFAAGAVATAAAGAYALKSPAQAAMSFDERLAHMANTAYAERDKAGRAIGVKELEVAVNKAVGKGGGGTREQAADTLDTLIASGAVGRSDAIAMLPQLMRHATASGADATQLAQIGIRGMQTFGIDAKDLPNILNMAIASGQAGGFELKDMSKWLPQQMAAATMSGLKGKEGFAKLAALNQAAAITAGTKDEAGNNVVNLLAKINSSDTAQDAKKMGINLPKYLIDQRAKGMDSVDAFAALVDKTVAGRADYQALQKQLSSAKNSDEKRAALESMAMVAQGAGIGKIIQDRQALMALLGMMNNREYMQNVLKTVRDNDVASGGAGDKNYELIADTSSFKLRQAQQQKDIGQKAAMDGLTPAIGRAAEAFADLATKHPVLVGSVTLATTAIGAMAGAAGLASIALGGGKGGPAGSAIGKAAAWAGASKAGQFALKAAKVGGIGGVAATAGGYALEKVAGEDSAVTRYGSSAMSGAALGATVGSVIPVLGTGVGAAIGGIGGLAWEGIKDLLKPAEQKPVDVNAKMTVGLAPGLVLHNQIMEATGPGEVKMYTGNLFTGVPG
ncbi:phage tail tape measure protein [Comamonas terrigena]|uniref:phage tail tape measure protein n=1 Tax=Comamonas terrigena TaxID=32013 RepID=UPI00244D60D5|nr:phage tail tape measure protein [Comamonas terrigena]MDH0048617.1 phage tail tape measure protein [Comamonas terrigena]MDH0511597.1 phage tail tape measure protein [Comamonas terrigena]MDH1090945.1 phage tail tape measure protein [Comamonas terrigena]